jgi:hypothetical protein
MKGLKKAHLGVSDDRDIGRTMERNVSNCPAVHVVLQHHIQLKAETNS